MHKMISSPDGHLIFLGVVGKYIPFVSADEPVSEALRSKTDSSRLEIQHSANSSLFSMSAKRDSVAFKRSSRIGLLKCD